jgi:hypothetical protein
MPETALFEVPNLDCLSADPGDLLHAAAVLSLLAAYAEHTGRAMELRAAGDVDAALSFERCAQASYRRLPQWARW